MSTAGHTPNFVAEEAVYPFRCVKVGSLPFKAVQSTGDPEILLGVTDGSVQGFNSTVHAAIGQPISLQNGEFVQLTAGGSIATGDTLVASTDGKVVAGTSSTEYIAQAVEDAEDGEVFWAKKIGAWTVGGGGGGGTMTVNVQEFDDPDAGGTWSKPAGAKWVTIAMCGGGSDGGNGDEYTSGFGGGAGRYAEKQFDASLLPSMLAVQVGLNRPTTAFSYSSFSSYVFANGEVILSATCGGAFGTNFDPVQGPFFQSGFSPWWSGVDDAPNYAFGNGGGEEANGSANGSVGYGPGGGGYGGNDSYSTSNGGAGGAAGRAYIYAVAPATGGGGAGGAGNTGNDPGSNGSNGSIDPLTGFGSGGGGGGESGSDVAGNGGNGVRGGGGGGGGKSASGTPGIGGAGGYGYVRITTICFS